MNAGVLHHAGAAPKGKHNNAPRRPAEVPKNGTGVKRCFSGALNNLADPLGQRANARQGKRIRKYPREGPGKKTNPWRRAVI